MAEDFAVGSADDLGFDEILGVLSAGYGRPFERDWFEWKHREGPWGPSRIVVARDGGGLLGVVFGLPWEYRVDGARVHGIRLVDGATTPRATRRGVFGAIVRELLDPTDGAATPPMVIATATPAAQAAHVKNGAVALDPIDFALRPVLPGRAAVVAEGAMDRYDPVDDAGVRRTGWDGASLRWRCDPRSGIAYRSARLRNGDTPHGLIYTVSQRRGIRAISVTALWGSPRERHALIRSIAREHRAIAVLGPVGPGTTQRRTVPSVRRGRSLLCVWDRTPTEDQASDTLAGWSLSGLDLEGVV